MQRTVLGFRLLAASWGIALTSVLLVSQYSLYGPAIFVLAVAVFALAMVLTLRTLDKFAAMLLFLVGVISLFLGLALLRLMPYLGYVGQIANFLSLTLFASLLLSFTLLSYWRSIHIGRLGFEKLVVITQIILVIAQCGVFGAGRFIPMWEAKEAEVQIIRVGNSRMSLPLIEGNIAFMAQEPSMQGGALYQIDIAEGVVLQEVPLPTFTQDELGHPDWYIFELAIWRAVITRVDAHTLELQYPVSFTKEGTPGLVDLPFSIKHTVDLSLGKVTSWEKFEGEAEQVGFIPAPRQFLDHTLDWQVGQYRVFWEKQKLNFQSPNKSFALRCSAPTWLVALEDDTLLMYQYEYLHIIR